MGSVCMLLFMEHYPPLYHAYFAMTIFLWIQISCEYQFIKALWRYVHRRETSHLVKLVASFVISVFVLEILVHYIIPRQSFKMIIFWILFEILHLILYAGEKLHEQAALYLDFRACWGYCFCLSSLLNTMEIWNTHFCLACLLVFVHFYFDACWNSR